MRIEAMIRLLYTFFQLVVPSRILNNVITIEDDVTKLETKENFYEVSKS